MWECPNCAGVCHDDEENCLSCGWPRAEGYPIEALPEEAGGE